MSRFHRRLHGNALRQDQDEYIDAGADRILTKPIKQAGIEECVAEARKRLRGETIPQGFHDHDEDEQEHGGRMDSIPTSGVATPRDEQA